MAQRNRPDKDGKAKAAFDKNKRRIYATQTVCAICGAPVDFTLRFPDPMSPTIDHIIPIAKGGHPSDIENMQLAHLSCNMRKGERVEIGSERFRKEKKEVISNRLLPHATDWAAYRGE